MYVRSVGLHELVGVRNEGHSWSSLHLDQLILKFLLLLGHHCELPPQRTNNVVLFIEFFFMLGNQRRLPFLGFIRGHVQLVVVFSLCILIFKHMDEGLSVSRRQLLARLRVLVKHVLFVRLDFSVTVIRLFCLNWPTPVHLTLILNTHLAPLDC